MMMIYKIHLYRVIAVSVTLFMLVSILVFLEPPQKCIQVSVSVQQWPYYHMKRTRVVQAVDEIIVTTKPRQNFILTAAKFNLNTDAFFRTRLVPSITEDKDEEAVVDEDDTEGYEDNGDDEYYEADFLDGNRVFEDGDFDYNETNPHIDLQQQQPSFKVVKLMYEAFLRKEAISTNGSISSSSVKTTDYSSPKYAFNNTSSIKSSQNAHKKLKHKYRNITLINIEGVPIVEDRIYWSEELENNTPTGSEDSEAQVALLKLRNSKVKRVEPPTWNRCGRPKNQFVIFEDNSKACARYRSPHQYLVQGEVLSFYLARLLGITNVPVVALSEVKEDFSGQWGRDSVKKNLLDSKWETNTTVALIQWIENLERDKLPPALLTALLEKNVLSANSGSLLSLLVKKLVELLQWSDLIIFDYITGNYDRVASMQDAADKEKKPSILRETVHNLVRSKTTGALWLIDNESGLLDSYSLLYGPAGQDGRFRAFHQQMLNTTCLFRRSTVQRIQWLQRTNEAGQILMNLVKQLEPLFTPIQKPEEVSKRLQERIGEVNKHIKNCISNVS